MCTSASRLGDALPTSAPARLCDARVGSVTQPVEYHPAAVTDLEEAVNFYAGRLAALGAAFHAEVKRTERLASEHPEAGLPLDGDVRRWLVDRFPFALIYAVEPERVYVLALSPSAPSASAMSPTLRVLTPSR